MRKIIFQFLFFCTLTFFAQERKYILYDNQEKRSSFSNENKLLNALDSLTKSGFYSLKIDSITTHNSEKKYFIQKGKAYKKIKIQLDGNSQKVFQKAEIDTQNVDSLLQIIHNYYLKEGFPFNSVQLKKEKNQLKIYTQLQKQYHINGLVWEGNPKISKNFIKQTANTFIDELYSDEKLKNINDYISQQTFLTISQSPKVLFTKDSAIVYLYVKRSKSSFFDGIAGIANDKSGKTQFNTNLKLELGNVFNGMEKIAINYISTPEKSQDLTFFVDIPYAIRSKIGIQTQLNIYRQDSTFANFKLQTNLYYRLQYNQKLGLVALLESSSFISSTTTFGKDFTKKGIGMNYEYYKPFPNRLIGNTTDFKLQTLWLNNKVESSKRREQYNIDILASKQFLWKERHYFQLKLHAQTLLSDSLVSNELYRIGGLRSIRGFNEQSIFASTFSIATLEYKFAPNEQYYFNVFSDFAWIENKSINQQSNLLGLGFGVAFTTKFGLLSVQHALGKFNNSAFNFDDSKVHIGIISRF